MENRVSKCNKERLEGKPKVVKCLWKLDYICCRKRKRGRSKNLQWLIIHFELKNVKKKKTLNKVQYKCCKIHSNNQI